MSSITLQTALKSGKEYARHEIRKGKLAITVLAEMKPREALPGHIESRYGIYLSDYRKGWDITIHFSFDLSSGGDMKHGKLSLPETTLEDLSKLDLVASLSYTYHENPEKSVLRIFNLPNNIHSVELLEKIDKLTIEPLVQKYGSPS